MHQNAKCRVDHMVVFSIMQNGGRPPSWIFKLYALVNYGMPVCICMPNFVPIGRAFANFRFFKMAAARHISLVLCVCEQPTKSICWSLSLCKIWLESVA